MPNFEQPPVINTVPGNNVDDIQNFEDEAIKTENGEDKIENGEEVESRLNQEPLKTEAEDQNFEEVFGKSEKGEDDKTKKSWLRKNFQNLVTGAAILGSLGHVGDALSESSDKNFTGEAKNNTEQLASVETQGQKVKIIDPYKDLPEFYWNELVDSLGTVSLYELAGKIRQVVPGTYFINAKKGENRENAIKILNDAKNHLIPGVSMIFCFVDDNSGIPRFSKKSRYEDETGKVRDKLTSYDAMPDRIAFIDIKNGIIKLVFATK